MAKAQAITSSSSVRYVGSVAQYLSKLAAEAPEFDLVVDRDMDLVGARPRGIFHIFCFFVCGPLGL